MLKKIAFSSALVIALLVAPAVSMNAQSVSTTTPSAVTGGDPQPTGESTGTILSLIPSLVVL